MTRNMETQSQTKAKLKRQRDDNDRDQRKSQRLASSSEAERTTKIIDLNDDCLIKVFGYLDLQCLFNVAIANEWLRPAARHVYTRKFAKSSVEKRKMVYISSCDDFRRNTRANARNAETKASVLMGYKWRNNIFITGLKQCLLFLRCFGPAITDLYIDYKNSESKRYSYVHQYIDDYCTESLTRIKFQRMPNIAIEQFKKGFVRVEDVDISNCHLGVQSLNTFVECFPNVRRLEIQSVGMERSDGLTKSFKHLEHLDIFDCSEATINQLVTDLLREAHQLESMKIRIIGEHKFPIETLLDMLKDKPLLTKLQHDSWEMPWHGSVNSAAVQRIINNHPVLVELGLPKFQFSLDGVNALIAQLNSLKKFRLAMRFEDYHVLEIQLKNEWTTSSWDSGNNDSIMVSSDRIEQ